MGLSVGRRWISGRVGRRRGAFVPDSEHSFCKAGEVRQRGFGASGRSQSNQPPGGRNREAPGRWAADGSEEP